MEPHKFMSGTTPANIASHAAYASAEHPPQHPQLLQQPHILQPKPKPKPQPLSLVEEDASAGAYLLVFVVLLVGPVAQRGGLHAAAGQLDDVLRTCLVDEVGEHHNTRVPAQDLSQNDEMTNSEMQWLAAAAAAAEAAA
jgi:hypothetical protein